MALKFGSLHIPHETCTVQKTGFPFFDACQVVGAAHLFFRHHVHTLEDRGNHWILTGNVAPVESTQPLIDLGNRLIHHGLKRIENTTLVYLEQLSDPQQLEQTLDYYRQTFPKSAQGLPQDTLSRFLEPSLQAGLKGPDGASYRTIASQLGVSSLRPIPELVVATLGLTQVSIAQDSGEIYTLLPIFKTGNQELAPYSPPIPAYSSRHASGATTSAMWACLKILDHARAYPIKDFAYAYHGPRGFSHSGVFSLSQLCHIRWIAPEYLEQSLNFFAATANSDQRSVTRLAKGLNRFLRYPNLQNYSALPALKARVLSDANITACIEKATLELLGTARAIEQAGDLLELAVR